eukprot:12562667-Heterocapsa_arctica.AAC.1
MLFSRRSVWRACVKAPPALRRRTPKGLSPSSPMWRLLLLRSGPSTSPGGGGAGPARYNSSEATAS